jgi:anti-sigma B factor antagonist/stage II sporulation protein AA (anti-sigma F factor antagonist)
MLDSDGYQVRVVDVQGEPVVEVAGEIDLHARQDLVTAIDSASTAGRRLVVDLSQTTFIDSAALTALLDAWRSQNAAGRELVLRKPSPVVVRTLEITGLIEALTIDGTDDPDDQLRT